MKNQYWTFKDGILSDKTKQEQIKGKNPFIIWDYLDLFKKYNIPMIYKEWYYRLYKQYKNNKTYQEIQRIVFGKYLATMKLKGYKDYTFKDSRHFNYCDKIPINSQQKYCYVREDKTLEKIRQGKGLSPI